MLVTTCAAALEHKPHQAVTSGASFTEVSCEFSVVIDLL